MFEDRKVKLYVNWKANEILNEEEFDKEVEDEIQCRIEDDTIFSKFLSDEFFDYADVFKLTPEDKEEVFEKFEKQVKEDVLSDLLNGDWEEVEVGIVLN